MMTLKHLTLLHDVVYLLAEQSKSPQGLQELFAATLVEMQSRRGRAGLLQLQHQKGPTFFLQDDGPQVTESEAERTPTLLVAVV